MSSFDGQMASQRGLRDLSRERKQRGYDDFDKIREQKAESVRQRDAFVRARNAGYDPFAPERRETYNPAAGPRSLQQNSSPLAAKPDAPGLDPVSARQNQNRLVAQQRAVDQQIRALRRQRARGGSLTPEQIAQLGQLEQQAVELRQSSADAFRLRKELEGRGPLSPSEAAESKRRLAMQVAEVRKNVLGQAQDELDGRFARQVERQQAGIPDYRPEGMQDRREMQLREELAGPTPGEARANFMAERTGITPDGRATTQKIRNTERMDREARMKQVREQERFRQFNEQREREIANAEETRALDVRETRGQIDQIAADTEVQRARNAARGAEVESRGLELAGRRFDQEINRIDQLGEAELELAGAEIDRGIAEARAAAEAAPGDMQMRRRLQELEGEYKAVQLQQALKTLEAGPRVDPNTRTMIVDGIADSFMEINGNPIRGERIQRLGVMRSAVDTIKRMPSDEDKQSVAAEVLNRIRALNGSYKVEGAPVPFTATADFFRNFYVDGGDATDKLLARRREQERIISELMDIAGMSAGSEEQ